jgi:putative DNA primase/helicase
MTLDELVALLDSRGLQPKPTGRDKWQACCPGHDDRNPSLSVGIGRDACLLLHCHASCNIGDVLAELGISEGDLFSSNGHGFHQPTAEEHYLYRSASGQIVMRVTRRPGKKFTQSRPDGHAWIWNAKGVKKVLYRLPEVLKAVAEGQPIYVVEGERDVATLERVGLVATTNPGGAGVGKWKPEYSEALSGAHVVVIADNDEAGLKHARAVVQSLTGVAAKVELFACPNGHNDITDYLAAGGKVDGLEPLGMPTRDADQVIPMFVADILNKHPEISEDDIRGAKTFSDLQRLLGEKESAATKIVNVVRNAGTILFHDDAERAFATITRDGHAETWPIKSHGFELWVRHLMWTMTGEATEAERDADVDDDDLATSTGSATSATALRDAIAQLQAEAVFAGEETTVHVRVAFVQDGVYIDLGDPDWRCIEITPDGWTVLDHHPVRFRRARGTRALPEPSRDGDLNLLRAFVNVVSEDDWHLLVAWLVNTVREGRPFPLLNLHGEHGSAKTTATRVLRAVVDPVSEPEVRATPRSNDDLMIAAANSWVVAYDNLSHLEPWLSDALCRLATGGGLGKRMLYTDDDEITLAAKRPVVLNAIDEVITRSDLLDRALNVELPPITEGQRLDESEFWDGFSHAHAAILGGLCNAIAGALANYPAVELTETPRMADFAKWIVAAEPALGWERGSFLTSYTKNRSESDRVAVEASVVGTVLCEIADAGFEDDFSTLLERLTDLVDEKVTRQRDWPKTPRGLSSSVMRLSPNLRKLGYVVERHGLDPRSRRPIIELRRRA